MLQNQLDTFEFRRKHCEDLGYKSKFYGTHQACPHSGWTGKGHVGSQVLEQKMIFSKKYKDQNDRIGKIYRFTRPLVERKKLVAVAKVVRMPGKYT